MTTKENLLIFGVKIGVLKKNTKVVKITRETSHYYIIIIYEYYICKFIFYYTEIPSN